MCVWQRWIFLNLWIVAWVVVYFQLKAEGGAGAEQANQEHGTPQAPGPQIGAVPELHEMAAPPEAAE